MASLAMLLWLNAGVGNDERDELVTERGVAACCGVAVGIGS